MWVLDRVARNASWWVSSGTVAQYQVIGPFAEGWTLRRVCLAVSGNAFVGQMVVGFVLSQSPEATAEAFASGQALCGSNAETMWLGKPVWWLISDQRGCAYFEMPLSVRVVGGASWVLGMSKSYGNVGEHVICGVEADEWVWLAAPPAAGGGGNEGVGG